MKKNVLILICLLGIVACEKDNKNSDSKIHFTGITSTSRFNELMSQPDTTDWRFDDKWSDKEENLFNSAVVSGENTDAGISLYPNPFSHVGFIVFQNTEKNNTLQLRLVDQDLNVLYSKDTVISDYSAEIRIEPQYLVRNNSDTLRIYYRLIDSLNNQHFGHGDIVIFSNNYDRH